MSGTIRRYARHVFPSGLDQQPLVRLVRISCIILVFRQNFVPDPAWQQAGAIFIAAGPRQFLHPPTAYDYSKYCCCSWLARLKRSSRPATASAAAELQRGPGRTPPNQHR